MSKGWAVVLNGTILEGGDPISPGDGELVAGCLTRPPAGLSAPPLRVEDQTFPQRDGAAQYADWYEPRVITLEEVSIAPDGCPGCSSARVKAKRLSAAWARECGQSELVIFTDCHGETVDPDPQFLYSNEATNPALANNATGWSSPAGTAVRNNGVATPAGVASQYSWYVTVPGGTTPQIDFNVTGPSQMTAGPGIPYQAGMWIRLNAPGMVYARITIGSTSLVTPTNILTSNTWVFIKTPQIVSSTIDRLSVSFYVPSMWGVTTMRGTGLNLTSYYPLGDYFDGDSVSDGYLQYEWSGTPGSSVTDLYAITNPREINGPFGMVGRPRVADIEWLGQGSKVAEGLFRFDGVDHRLYILDEDGTPGSGGQCSLPFRVTADSPIYPALVSDNTKTLSYWKLDDKYAASSGPAVDQKARDDGLVFDAFEPYSNYAQPRLAPGLSKSMGLIIDEAGFEVSAPSFTSAFALEFWFNTSNPGVLIYATPQFNLTMNTFTKWTLRWRNIDYVLNVSGQGSNSGATHIVINQSGANLTVYRNGFQIFTTAGVATGSVAAMDWKGGLTAGNPLPGYRISDFAIYNAPLTADEVAAHFAAAFRVGGTTTINVGGDVSVPFTIEFTAPLSSPTISLPDGSYVGLSSMPPGASSVVLDTATGLLTYSNSQGIEVSESSSIVGNPFLELQPGVNFVTLQSDSGADTGTATMCWRPAVLSA